jgi:hypothetical protein
MLTPQDTQDIAAGSGALGYDWWVVRGHTRFDTPDWRIDLELIDPQDGEVLHTLAVTHHTIMETARMVAANAGKRQTYQWGNYAAWSTSLERNVTRLLRNDDSHDFDAANADELLQLALAGEVVFG